MGNDNEGMSVRDRASVKAPMPKTLSELQVATARAALTDAIEAGEKRIPVCRENGDHDIADELAGVIAKYKRQLEALGPGPVLRRGKA